MQLFLVISPPQTVRLSMECPTLSSGREGREQDWLVDGTYTSTLAPGMLSPPNIKMPMIKRVQSNKENLNKGKSHRMNQK
jgi:hypothetical protein